ncbi:hypothetical protein A3H89_00575 [Candidatus Amesbacteria bacterium RIFCSPLOWO2_02_FULL_48_11]|nr:MAG: hypothetical protein A3H89_00575 [Candidatus Amesbacteria bacterium RIFCSPLOWO2_02_FULL_48_11]
MARHVDREKWDGFWELVVKCESEGRELSLGEAEAAGYSRPKTLDLLSVYRRQKKIGARVLEIPESGLKVWAIRWPGGKFKLPDGRIIDGIESGGGSKEKK